MSIRFAFLVNDGLRDSLTATVTLVVDAVNDRPTADNLALSLDEDTSISLTLTGGDVDGDGISFVLLSQPGNGTLHGSAPNLLYTPAANFSGSDHFTFAATDGDLDSLAATVVITVNALADVPVATGQTISTTEDTPVTITLNASDSDSDNNSDNDADPLVYTLTQLPTQGVVGGVAPDLVYTPAVGFNGVDHIAFRVNDGLLDSSEALISITVTPLNNAP